MPTGLAKGTDSKDMGSVGKPQLLLPHQSLQPSQLGVIVNDADPLSRRIGDYYRKRRGIPSANLIHVRFAPGRSVMGVSAFQAIYKGVLRDTPAEVQAYALTWAAPYRVGCMSITTAFAAGYDEAYCAQGCRTTKRSDYFGATRFELPMTRGLRLTMALAGTDFAEVKSLIDRGIGADDTRPGGTGYLVETHDRARSVRAANFDQLVSSLGDAVVLKHVKADSIARKTDVLFYLTGLARVPDISTNGYLPGAIADHLTSTGGRLTDSGQMSSLDWLKAGATGSYGTVVEPCNLLGKFPDPGVLISAYLSGATLIEAYWKSVLMPGQGIFIGEPLARPFGGYSVRFDGMSWVMTTYALTPGRYRLEGAPDPMGPYGEVGRFEKAGAKPVELRLPANGGDYYRVVADPGAG